LLHLFIGFFLLLVGVGFKIIVYFITQNAADQEKIISELASGDTEIGDVDYENLEVKKTISTFLHEIKMSSKKVIFSKNCDLLV
jgi:hypothetical protein